MSVVCVNVCNHAVFSVVKNIFAVSQREAATTVDMEIGVVVLSEK